MKRSSSFSLSLGGSILVFALVLLVRMVSQPAQAAPYPTYGSEKAITNALEVILGAQMPDGGIGGWMPGQSDMFTSIRSAIAVVQAGERLESVAKNGATLIDYLETQVVTYTSEVTSAPGRAGMLLTAVAGGNLNPTNFGGVNLVDIVASSYVSDTGVYGPAGVMNQLWAMIGLSAAGEPVPAKATQWLINQQLSSGAWSLSTPDWADAESTAMVMVALLNSGQVKPSHVAIQKAISYLREQQQPNGGWGSDWITKLPGNPDATAWVVQALAAAGYTPVAQNWMAMANPRHLLLNNTPKNALSAANIILGLVESPIALTGSHARAARALAWANQEQDKIGAWKSTEIAGVFSIPSAVDAIRAYAAAGFDPNTVKVPGGVSPVQFLETSVSTTTFMSSGSPPIVHADVVGKMILGVVAADKNPRDFGDVHVNLIHLLNDVYMSGAFSDTQSVEAQAYAILGLLAAGEPVYDSMVEQLLTLQQSNGGWNYSWAEEASPAATGLALQALAAASPHISGFDLINSIIAATDSAKGYLLKMQDANGGWGDTASTAMVIQGLAKTPGVNLYDMTWMKGNRSAYHALFAAQDSDGPFAGVQRDDDLAASFAAVQAMFADSQQGNDKPFEGFGSYLDADRAVPAQPWATRNGTIVAPIGSDSNRNAQVKMEWAPIMSSEWYPVTTTRLVTDSGAVTSSVALSPTTSYKFRSTYTDPDGVQTISGVTTSTVKMGYLGVAETVVRPAVSTWATQTDSLRYSNSQYEFIVEFLARSLDRVTKFLYSPMINPTAALPENVKGVGFGLMQAVQGEGLLDNLELTKPATITIKYIDAMVAGLDEGSLKVWYRDGNTWKNASESCVTPTSYTRDPAANTLSVPVCRTGEFAVAGTAEEVVKPVVSSVTLSPDTIVTIAEGSTTTITATVEDANSTRLAGQDVTFVVSGTSTIAPASSTSDSNGQAATTLTGVEGWSMVYAQSGGKNATVPVMVQVLKQNEYDNLAAPPVQGVPGDTLTIPTISGSLISGGTANVPASMTVGGLAVARASISILVSSTESLDTLPANSRPMATILLSLYDADGNELSGNLSAPVTIVLNFSGVPAGYIAQTMRAFYFAGGKWTNDGITITNPAFDTFTFTTSHASEFAVSIANKMQVYLPVVQR